MREVTTIIYYKNFARDEKVTGIFDCDNFFAATLPLLKTKLNAYDYGHNNSTLHSPHF